MLGLTRKKNRELVEKIEALADTDLDRAAEELAASRRRLKPADAGRLAGMIRSRIHAREQVEYLSRGLAEKVRI